MLTRWGRRSWFCWQGSLRNTQGFKTLSVEFIRIPHSRSRSFPIFPVRSWQVINPTGIVILQPTQLNYGLICSKFSSVATEYKRFFWGCYRNSDYPTVSLVESLKAWSLSFFSQSTHQCNQRQLPYLLVFAVFIPTKTKQNKTKKYDSYLVSKAFASTNTHHNQLQETIYLIMIPMHVMDY